MEAASWRSLLERGIQRFIVDGVKGEVGRVGYSSMALCLRWRYAFRTAL